MKTHHAIATLAVALAASVAAPAAHAQAAGNLREVIGQALAGAGIGKENTVLVQRMLSVKPGAPFSAAFDPLLAARAADPRTRLTADPECSRQKLPGNDPFAVNERCLYRFGEPTGQDATAVQLRFSRQTGKFSYLHRTRSFDANRMADNKVPADAAREAALKLARSFGLPPEEIDTKFVQVLDLNVAAEPVQQAPGAAAVGERIVKRAEVHVRVPRRLGDWPVFDSGFMVAFGDDGSGRPRPSRLNGRWPDFGLLLPAVQSDEVFSDADLLARMVEDLSPEIRLPLDPKTTRAFIAFVQAAEFTKCAVTGDGGDDDAGGAGGHTRPQDLLRLFVPAVVFFAVPPDPGEMKETKLAPSTGVLQRSYPLIRLGARLCDGSV